MMRAPRPASTPARPARASTATGSRAVSTFPLAVYGIDPAVEDGDQERALVADRHHSPGADFRVGCDLTGRPATPRRWRTARGARTWGSGTPLSAAGDGPSAW